MLHLSAFGSVFKIGRTYVARITGRDPKYVFAREFCHGRREASNSGRTWVYSSVIEQPGLYEVQSSGKRGPDREYYVVEPQEDGTLTARQVSYEEALKLAAAMDQ